MMTQKLFLETLDKLEKSNTVYGLGMWGQPITEAIITSKSNQLPTWYKKNADKIRPYINKGYFGFDCVCMIKSILWGFSFNLNASNGGAKYASNGVPDINADTLITKCTDVSTDFTKIIPGAVVWIKGHVGVYVGNGQVIECTADWSRRVLRSHLGNLNYKGDYVRKWSKWGKLPWIEYTDFTTPPVLKYHGTLDSVTESSISGWAWNNVDDTVLNVDIKIYKGLFNKKTLTVSANQYRDDLKTAKKGNGQHAFSISFDFLNTLGEGTYTVKAYTNGVQLVNEKTIKIEKKVTVQPTSSTPTSSSNSSEYYAKYTGSSSSLDEIFKTIGVPSEYIKDKSGETYEVRKPVAEANGIPCYIGSSEQNTLLKNLAKNGKLRRVKATTSTVAPTPAPKPTTPSLRKLQDGDVIQLVSNATYHNGASIPSWVFKKTLYFRGKDSGKNTVKFSTAQTGAVTGRINPSSIVGYGSSVTI